MSFDLAKLDSLLRTEYIGRNVSSHESVDTTMRIAAEQAGAGVPEGTIVLAEEQTAGRGRMQRSWISPPGVSVYVTVVLRPALGQLRYLAMIAPLAVSLAIEETTGLFPRLKWPNDVLIEGKKVAGVLPESELEGERVMYALLGIGINCNFDASAHEEIRDIATSLKTQLGHDVPREEVLAAALNHLESLYEALKRGEVVSMDWKQRLETLGQQVRIERAGGGSESGTVVDADSDGSIILRRDDGSHIRIESGEVLGR